MSLASAAPFHLEATVRVLQRRPNNPVERLVDGRYSRVLRTAEGLVLVAVENRASIDAPELELELRMMAGRPSAATRREIERAVRTALGLDVIPVELQAAVERSSALRPIALALRGMRPPRFVGLFEVFANVIPFQQLSLAAGAAILERIVERFGERFEHDGRSFRAFPTAQSVARARLTTLLACGLSRSKALSLRELAKLVDSGAVAAEAIAGLETRDARDLLVRLPGIGPWSAAVILLRGFGRLDVFPAGDSGATRALSTLFGLRAPSELAGVIERFGPCRGYLYFFALGSRLLAEGLIQAAPSAKQPPGRARSSVGR